MSLPSYAWSILTAIGILLIVDLLFGLIKSTRFYSIPGLKALVLEAGIVTAGVVAFIAFIYPDYSVGTNDGVFGYLLYGLLYIPIVIALNRQTSELRYVIPPIGVGAIFCIGGLVIYFVASLLTVILDTFLISVLGYSLPSSQVEALHQIAFPTTGVIAMFLGASLSTVAVEGAKEERTARKERQSASAVLSSRSNDSLEEFTERELDSNSFLEHELDTAHSPKTEGAEETCQHPLMKPERWTEDQLAEREFDWRYSETDFDAIGGYYDVKTALHKQVIEPWTAQEDGESRFSRFNIEPERGIILYGPPGTGKTLFARGLAGELGVPFVELSPADVTSMWVNESSQQVKKLFDEARELRRCVVFLDEAEHLFGARRSEHSTHAEDRKVTTEFLAQLTRDNADVIVVAATNRPGDIDAAIMRPGRLTAHFEIGFPDEETRHAILEVHLSEVPSTVSGDELAEIAAHTDRLTGAELADLVEQARRSAADRDAMAVAREDFPSAADLQTLASSHGPEPDQTDLPTPDDGGDDEDDTLGTGPSPDEAPRTDRDDDGSPIGYQ